MKRGGGDGSSASGPRVRREFLAGLVLAVLVVGAYWGLWRAAFIHYDDYVYVVENPAVAKGLTLEGLRWAATYRNWHPLTWLSHMLDVTLFGLDPGGHHLSSLLLHVANVLLFFAVLRRMTGDFTRSALAAGIFALHPVNVEAVAWVSQRKSLLCTLFWLLAMASYCRYTERPSLRRYLPVALCFALGLAAKSMIVTLPFVLLLLDYWPLGRWRGSGAGAASIPPPAGLGRLVAEKAPLFGIAGLAAAVTYHAQESMQAVQTLDAFPMGLRVANAVVSYAAYLAKAVWPHPLAVFYPYPQAIPWWQPAAAGAAIALVSVAVARGRRRRPHLLVGWLWFLGTLVPVIGLVQIGVQAMADRYLYTPMPGLLLMAAWSLPLGRRAAGGRARGLWAAAGGGVLAVLFLLTRVQAGYWADSVRLFEHTLAVTRGNYMIENNLGVALRERCRPEAALDHFRTALRLRPDMREARDNVRRTLAALERQDPSTLADRRALRNAAPEVLRHYLRGNLFRRAGDIRRARREYEAALDLDPEFLPAASGTGVLLAMGGDYEGARKWFSAVADRVPEAAEPVYLIAATHARQGHRREALRWLAAAAGRGFADAERLKNDPNFEAMRNLPQFADIIDGMMKE